MTKKELIVEINNKIKNIIVHPDYNIQQPFFNIYTPNLNIEVRGKNIMFSKMVDYRIFGWKNLKALNKNELQEINKFLTGKRFKNHEIRIMRGKMW